ncbi:lysophosphatidylcholine acyltransferase isoform X1 [Microplitis mediator]|uniref:lysophosphatidylcholine acyltransferase isoform X1 n=1 Tax=Microplitis mediator TaxID=375433 RepID=UPI0025549C0F|nr:lysophosphatidylcholine acyltransferase isoform X1 [Microplitis mediator]XP_057332309.1 lysophosphatidylcholine acyltransferase isoform X1 [Microplitis mediator]XP_057332310.1 lysophosphatidylcholine acyltransferase isoform X1 [Microplitis mediator]XP_057332311.1 lysophosphatidylcholine acyltransferase isoform X1 [Microplitis mediator]
MEKINSVMRDNTSELKSPSIDTDILNPFVHRLELDTTYEKLKTAFLTVALLPLRLAAITALVIIGWLLACLGLHGLSEDDLRRAPLTGWRRDMRVLVCWVMRAMFVCGGFHHLKVKGQKATTKDAPVLALAPHSSFFDALPVVYLGGPSIVAKAETGRIPFFGKLINYTQPVYVWRDDPNSRQNTIKEIIERATSKEDWPQIMIFPEGTCTNRSCLITFKCGAFYPGVPVQPVCIRYPNKLDTVTWTWEGPGALKLLWLTLTQLNSSCEIEFLPVYRPSEAEKTDPKLYANNVRRLMAEALEIPVSDYTYDDCRIINKAHMLHLPHAAVIVEAHKLRCKLGLQKVKVEEELVQKRLVNIEETINFNEFARILRLDAKDPSVQQLFRIHDRANKGTIDIEEYIFTVLAIANANSVLDLVDIAFNVCDANGTKCLDAKKLRKALKLSLQLEPEESDRIFSQATREVSGSDAVSFEDVITVLGTRTEFTHIFADDNEVRRKKTI